jgi:hypothetical protein
MHIDNDYNYTQSAALVYDWLDKRLDIDSEVTHIDVKDMRSSQERPEGVNYYLNILEVHIFIYRSGDTARTVIRKTKQDVLKAMFETSFTGVDDIDYRGDEPEFDREKKLMGGTEMIFDVYYKTNRGQI